MKCASCSTVIDPLMGGYITVKQLLPVDVESAAAIDTVDAVCCSWPCVELLALAQQISETVEEEISRGR